MSSDNSLGEALSDAVNDWLAANGGGFPVSFVIAVDYVDSDGETNLTVSSMPGQRTRTTLGLIAEMDERTRMTSRREWATVDEGGA